MEIIGIIASWAVCLALIGYGLMAIFAADILAALLILIAYLLGHMWRIKP